jgi:hypothetical protein
MAHPSFGPGWPNCDRSNWVVLRRSDGWRVPVHRELVDMVAILCDLTEMMGFDIPPESSWGAACRPISGTNKASNHSWGTALDLDAPNNPHASADWHRRNANATIMGRRVRTNIPEKVFQMWKDWGWDLGVLYNTKPDPMHFEWLKSVQAARETTARLKQWIKDNGGIDPSPKEDRMLLRKGDQRPEWWAIGDSGKQYIPTPGHAAVGHREGRYDRPEPKVIEQAWIDEIPTMVTDAWVRQVVLDTVGWAREDIIKAINSKSTTTTLTAEQLDKVLDAVREELEQVKGLDQATIDQLKKLTPEAIIAELGEQLTK